MRSTLVLVFTKAAVGMSILFIPNLAADLFADEFMIGLIISAYGLASFLSMYLFGWVSDRLGRRTLIMWGVLFGCFTFAFQSFARNPQELLLVRALCGFSIGTYYSALLAYGFESGKKIGKFTAYDSLGWGLGSLIAGFIAVYSMIFTVSAAFFALAFLLAYGLCETSGPRLKVPLIPLKLILRNKRVYLPFFLRDIGAFSIWAFLPLYLGVVLGASKQWIGLIYFLNMGSQFVFKHFVDRYRYGMLFKFGMAASAASFIGYGLAPTYLWVLPVSVSTGLAWSALSVGAMGSLTKKNLEQATAIGLFSSSRSLAQIISPLIAAPLVAWGGYAPLFAFSTSITLLGLGLNLSLKKRDLLSNYPDFRNV